ncbi:MAG TPA: glycosyltransferase [Bacteroidales bacterium]|nr:glycosyltransferase [Bacteroidales bacterium]
MAYDLNATVIIAYYKRLDFLDKIFCGLSNQSMKNFEVIVAEDDNSPETIEYLDRQREKRPFIIKHVSQEDKGFRKNMILNEALKIATSENILFLDGDSVPHSEFCRMYYNNLRGGIACFGRRVMMGEKITASFLKDIDKPYPGFFFTYFFRCKEGRRSHLPALVPEIIQ